MDSGAVHIVLPQISRLLTALDTADSRYVHWKSNNNIDQALAGRDDLDLLVHPTGLTKTKALISELGYVRGFSEKDGWQRNMLHYFTMDAEAGQLVHLHLHSGLTLGYDYNKNYTLPLVDWYLEGRRRAGPIWVPRPEREFVIFVIRVLLKSATTGVVAEFPIRQLRALYRSETRAGVAREFDWLKRQGALEGLDESLASSGLPFSLDGFRRLAEVAERGRGAQLRCAAREVKQALAAMRDASEWRSLLACFWRVNLTRFERLRGGFSGRKMAGLGGRVIAFLGGDGAGKSTNSASLSRALGQHLAVESLHFGRPGRFLPGLCLAALSKLLTAAGQSVLAEDFRSLALAYDRRSVSRRAERARAAGRIVILDRLHRPEITHMDGPRIENARTPLRRWLAAREQRLYRQTVAADLLVVLRLDPKVACQRRPDDVRATLMARSDEVWRADWSAANMLVLDTGEMRREEVQARVFRRAWEEIARPFLRVEVLGLTGAGKSTLTRGLVREFGNASTGLPYRRHPGAVVRGIAGALAEGGWPHGGKERWQVFRNHAQMHAFLDLARRGKLTANCPATHLLLDQSPLFQLAMCLKEGRLKPESETVQRTISAFESLGGRAVFLAAPDELLRDRVERRPAQCSRGEGLSDDAFKIFLEGYAACFAELRNRMSNPAELSSENSAEATLRDALTQLNRGEAAW
ncbi:hypothetical protein KUV47_14525 [Vannielia litorea]|uniref:hypothetical protein n=1 Tax=Vannielia litorea TaxID=1217970 RepID=UPI001C98AA62|nr:hypothetical protein [Vannielia litorea]MBY6154435.1 hypothetical protein [Vannielia litorea]